MAATVTISTVDILSVATSVTIEFIPQSFPAASGSNIVLDNRYQVTTASDGTASLNLEEGVYDVRFLNLSGRGELTVQVPSSGTVTLASIITSTSPGFFSQLPRITTTQRDALTAKNGMMIYNTTANRAEKYENGQWQALGAGVGGSGDVIGPASATDLNIAVFSGTTGKLIDDGGKTINEIFGSRQSIQFNTAPTSIPTDPGYAYWNEEEETLNLILDASVTLQVGQEQVVRAKASEAVRNGSVVYASGAVGGSDVFAVSNFIADTSVDELYTLGIATETLALNDIGFISTYGKVRLVDTTVWSAGGVREETDGTWAVGDILYASATQAGALTKVIPTAPNLRIPLAMVTKVSGTNATLFVRISHGFHLNEIHDVLAASPADGDTIQWSSSNSRWQNTAHSSTTSGVHGISSFGATLNAGTSAADDRSILEIGGSSLGSISGTVSVDASNGITFAGTHSGNITNWTFSNVPTYYTCVLWNLVGTGGPYTVAFGGITVHETSNAIDTGTAAGDYYGILFSTIDGGTNWLITQAGGESLT